MINEEQAELVRKVFTEYLDGKSYNSIAKGLMKDEIKTVIGKQKWWDSQYAGCCKMRNIMELHFYKKP